MARLARNAPCIVGPIVSHGCGVAQGTPGPPLWPVFCPRPPSSAPRRDARARHDAVMPRDPPPPPPPHTPARQGAGGSGSGRPGTPGAGAGVGAGAGYQEHPAGRAERGPALPTALGAALHWNSRQPMQEPPPPPKTKVTIVGHSEIHNRENRIRPFLVHGPPPPPGLSSTVGLPGGRPRA